MADGDNRSDLRIAAELEALRRELNEMRAEQRELARTVEQMWRTFRALATQLGIAAEPYRRSGAESPARQDLPGFG